MRGQTQRRSRSLASVTLLAGALGTCLLAVGEAAEAQPGAAPMEAAAAATRAEPPPAPLPFPGAPEIRPCLALGELELGCVPGGAFLRGSNGRQANERPQQEVWLQTFYMDCYEVTFAEYQECARAGRCGPAKPIYPDFSRPRQPMVGVSWFDAVRYCEAQGKHLPTEAQWEKAARGTDGRRYPWGAKRATCKQAIIKDGRGRSCGVRQRGRYADRGRTFEVGTRAPTQFGLYDMAGNSWEWVADWYSKSYEACGAACEGLDPKGPCGGATPCRGHRHRVVRGGSWYWPANLATTTYRRYHVPSNKPYHHFGFRCAASHEELVALQAGAKAAAGGTSASPAEPSAAPTAEPPAAPPTQDAASAGPPGRSAPSDRK